MTAGELDQAGPKQSGPVTGSHGSVTGHSEVLDGPFTTRQLLRLDEALRLADRSTSLTFSVYVGELDEPVRAHAEKLHGQLADPDRSVLLAVSPNQRLLEIVTGAEARKRLPDRDAKLAALSMAAAFGGGDLAGGIVTGVAQLADHAGRR
ncbi:MAG TPA: DUF5130 family protein [Pseudonocardiaceae bacterium]|nr:DUF5130 family protein [Pseudonocardiaceae bacterium]